MDENKQITLGQTGIKISPIGIGIMQWGDMEIDQSTQENNKNVLEIYQASIIAGINFFDTAEAYGSGMSEMHLGKCLKDHPSNIVVATKFMPYPWRLSKGELRKALSRSLNRLGLSRVDLYQMHWPFPPVPVQSWMEAMADVIADGLITSVGVSNYSPSQVLLAYKTLEKHHIPLASNQVKYSLLDRRPEQSGLLDLCRKLGVTIIAYSPLEKGILTGKYTPDNLPTGFRSWRYGRNNIAKIMPLLYILHQIGEAHHGMTSSQVALNWLACKWAVPIPGARSKNQAEENSGALGWQLSEEEVAILDKVSREVAM